MAVSKKEVFTRVFVGLTTVSSDITQVVSANRRTSHDYLIGLRILRS